MHAKMYFEKRNVPFYVSVLIFLFCLDKERLSKGQDSAITEMCQFLSHLIPISMKGEHFENAK